MRAHDRGPLIVEDRGHGLFWLPRLVSCCRSARVVLMCFNVLILLGGCAGLGEGPEHPIGRRLLGAYVKGGVWQGMEPIHDVEAAIGRSFDITHWYANWDTAWDAELVAQVAHGGRIPLISWQSNNQPVREIAVGKFDAYIRSWARGVRNHDGPVYLRPFPEMNGDWVPWNGQPDMLVKAWRRIVDIFQAEGATNAYWVWSPNVTDWPRTPHNRMENYYPGSGYVDILALDGYNWGSTRPDLGWRSFEEIFEKPYERITALGSQPLWITEIASAEQGGDKARWIQDMLASRAFPKLEAIVWFDENKEADWRIRSSEASTTAFRRFFSASSGR